MNLSLIHARSFGRPLFIRPKHSYLCTITHQAQQNHLKQIYKSPNVTHPLLGFFSSISWITSSSAKVLQFPGSKTFVSSWLQESLLLYRQNRVLRGFGDSKFDDSL